MSRVQGFQAFLENDQLPSAIFQSRLHRLDIAAQAAHRFLAKGFEPQPVLFGETGEFIPYLAQPGTHLVHISRFGLQTGEILIHPKRQFVQFLQRPLMGLDALHPFFQILGARHDFPACRFGPRENLTVGFLLNFQVYRQIPQGQFALGHDRIELLPGFLGVAPHLLQGPAGSIEPAEEQERRGYQKNNENIAAVETETHRTASVRM